MWKVKGQAVCKNRWRNFPEADKLKKEKDKKNF